MSDIKLEAESRTEFGKGAARRIRRADKVPAVLYGHGEDPRHITLNGHAIMMALKTPNALLELTVDGAKDTTLAIAKDVQRHPVTYLIEHVDLIIVRRGERVEVDIPVHVTGEAAPGTLVSVDAQTLTVEAEATNLPESVEVDVEGREPGDHIYAADVVLPKGSTLVTDGEQLVVNISAELSQEQLEAELESDAVEGDAVPATEESGSDAESESEDSED
ncbi:50S ribosomal protein L25/general stress protein Ctc [Sediminivirga luteola]|uniref:Large ribosomal subunit protein bL25 n=1 Tax=Sediminivirga luteola TaxID=1774748 RepID=A0A8J2XLL4_9MICO|nr:50S ribosomal protein L25/general stress protein Ctc [Sediminivirga luteola]GGA19081.1 50S ribosomal protein L25 [Sediminivirga luteola]